MLTPEHRVAYTKLGQPELISGGVVVGDAAASAEPGIITQAVNPGADMCGEPLAGAP